MTAYSGWGFDLGGFKADVDLDNYQYWLVTTASTADNIKLATGASNPIPLGVLQNDPAAGDSAAVRVLGTSKVWANGGTAIAYGDWLTTNASGHAIVDTTACTHAFGMALEALASGCNFIEALLIPAAHVLADNVP